MVPAHLAFARPDFPLDDLSPPAPRIVVPRLRSIQLAEIQWKNPPNALKPVFKKLCKQKLRAFCIAVRPGGIASKNIQLSEIQLGNLLTQLTPRLKKLCKQKLRVFFYT
jgi:hypothetical protein